MREDIYALMQRSNSTEVYDWEKFKETSRWMNSLTDVFTRKFVTVLNELVEKAQSGEIAANFVLQYIDPMSRAPFMGESYLTTLGYFLDQKALDFAGDHKEEVLASLRSIHEARMNILGAANQPDPFIRSTHREILVETKLQEVGTENTDLIEAYLQQLEVLLALIESKSYSKEEIIFFLKHKLAQYQYMLDNDYGRGGAPLAPVMREHLTLEISHLEIGLQRLLSQA